MFLTLVPTLPPDAPLERCWSPWGQQRAAERDKAESKSKSLPSCTLFLTLPTLKLTVDSMQALQLWKWLEFSFILHGTERAVHLQTCRNVYLCLCKRILHSLAWAFTRKCPLIG